MGRGALSAASVDFATHPIHFFFLSYLVATSIQLRSPECVCLCVCACVFKGILSMSKPDATSQRQTAQNEMKKKKYKIKRVENPSARKNAKGNNLNGKSAMQSLSRSTLALAQTQQHRQSSLWSSI